MTSDTFEDLRTSSYELAEAIAPSWERRRDFIEEVSGPVRAWLVRELAPQPGQTVLELAAGVGDTGFEAAALLGEGGRLISTDFSPRMVDAARRRAAELGLQNVEHRVMDAERIELEADSVDGVLCRFGYMLMVDPAAALAETRRVLRSGGRLAVAVWGPPERNPFFGLTAMTLVQLGFMPPPDPNGPSPVSMGSEDRTRRLLADAGFGTVRMEEVPVRFTFRDLDDYVSMVADTAGPLALLVQGLSEQDRETFKARLREPLGQFAAGGGYELPAVALAAVAG